ncbi:MAG TPA: PIN domain-containing protein, partial [Candidatus Ozemobacteraceae bacterium]|nr:PIN domain-containing protein [Candidatus Ozemobacteraceae bacterium]
MRKTFVLDTNVLLHTHNSLFSFKDNEVVVPLGVIEELDRFKGHNDERGREARSVSRELDKLREKGPLTQGVEINNGAGLLRVMLDTDIEIPQGFDKNKVDNRIIACALDLKKAGKNVFLVSKDINARIKCDAIGVPAEDFETNKVDVDELYTGWRELVVTARDIDVFQKNQVLPCPVQGMYANEFVLLKAAENENKTALAKYKADSNNLVSLYHVSSKPYSVEPQNLQQKFAIELLLCNEIQLVTMVGRA